MKKPPAIAAGPTGSITVLAIDPSEQDHTALIDIFNNSPWSLCPDANWSLKTITTLQSAWVALRHGGVPVVLCEYDLCPGTWRELLERISSLPAPPFVIVTSRLADERLWAEALNLGAYDVLAKPFDPTEVVRVVSMAWFRWKEQYEATARERQVLVAAGGG